MSRLLVFFDELSITSISILRGCLLFLVVFLPFHGFLSVFYDPLRYWKELIITILLWFFVWRELLNLVSFFRGKIKLLSDNNLKSSSFVPFDVAELLAILFLLWGVFLVFINSEFERGLLALRYLGFGVLVYLIISRLLKFFPRVFADDFVSRYLFRYFIASVFVSILFGVWGKFGGGLEILGNLYSPTISSWVPGQKIPIFHEVFGIVRMQGGSSGPVEFGILCLMAFFLWGKLGIAYLHHNNKAKTPRKFSFVNIWLGSFVLFVTFVLLFGVYQSYSRAALGGVIIISFYFLWILFLSRYWRRFAKWFFAKSKLVKTAQILFLFIVFLTSFKLLITKTDILVSFEEKFIERVGTSDHFTRPVEAFKVGADNFLWGNLGALGPAARQYNLVHHNSDQALIAENVWVDIFAQMGILGIIFYILFWLFAFLRVQKSAGILFFVLFLIANTATIFDMTPISILVFLLLVLFSKSLKKRV